MKDFRSVIVLIPVFLVGWGACDLFRDEPEINSIRFDGDFHLMVEADSVLREAFGGSFAIEMWIMGDTVKTLFDRPVVSLSGEREELLGVYEFHKDSSVLFISAGGDTMFLSLLGDDYRRKSFYHVCVTRQYDILYVSVNGSFAGKMVVPGKGFSVDEIYIGGNAGGKRWRGYMDEFRLWKCYKSPSFVEFHYNNPDKLCIHYSEDCLDDLVILYRFNESWYDEIPNEAAPDCCARVVGNVSENNWVDKGVD